KMIHKKINKFKGQKIINESTLQTDKNIAPKNDYSLDHNVTKTAARSNPVKVHKCCEHYEVMINARCTTNNETVITSWKPLFTTEDGKTNIQISDFKLVTGIPQCGSQQPWPIYHYHGSNDQFGIITHCIKLTQDHDLLTEHQDDHGETHWWYDYQPGTYCLDKAKNDDLEAQIAIVCVPVIGANTSDTDYIMRRIVDPVFHGLAMIFYLYIAVVYFVVPQLRDLVGNILSTIALCMITSQAADLVRIFTELVSHISFMVAALLGNCSLMAAFFWLNSLGYYIWKTFRSRNVFLRVTDGRKYCYYSCYAWGCTAVMAAISLFAHFMLDTTQTKDLKPSLFQTQKTIGWLGKAVFFTPVAFTILINIFFYLTTGHVINQMSTYGRIHHKMKYSFELFMKLFLMMAVAWLFLLLSWLREESHSYCVSIAVVVASHRSQWTQWNGGKKCPL
ncbi:hypothetical protein L9F63_009527, partial [Diploptera punctata]